MVKNKGQDVIFYYILSDCNFIGNEDRSKYSLFLLAASYRRFIFKSSFLKISWCPLGKLFWVAASSTYEKYYNSWSSSMKNVTTWSPRSNGLKDKSINRFLCD